MSHRKPVVIDLGTPAEKPRRSAQTTSASASDLSPAEVPPVPDDIDQAPVLTPPATAFALHRLAKGWSIWTRLFFGLTGALVSAMLITAFWDFAVGMAARHLWLGYATWGMLSVLALAASVLVLRELAALSRMRRVDRLRAQADGIRTAPTLEDVQGLLEQMTRFYRDRADLRWAFADVAENGAALLDGDALRDVLERSVMTPLDKQAQEAILNASRQVAITTAVVPLALADVTVALIANVRMVRQIAEIYGGRAGGLGSWRLMRAVAAHLVATGAVAISDDLIGSVAGGGVLSKVSRRFGEGMINGALTTRVGIAALEVCRPMPFIATEKPRVTQLVKRALTGVFV